MKKLFANNLGKLCILCMVLAYCLTPAEYMVMSLFGVFIVFRAVALKMAGWGWFEAPVSYSKMDRYMDASRARWYK